MHIPDGVLSAPVLVAGWAACGVGVVASTRQLDDDDLPRIAVMTSAFFVASLLHIPTPWGSLHLSLCGLMGIVLGRRVFVAIAVATLLQSLLTSHGGMTNIGPTTVVLGLPAWLVGTLFRLFCSERPIQTQVTGATLLSAVATLLAAGLQYTLIACSGSELRLAASAAVATLAILPLLEAMVAGPAALFLCKVHPALLGGHAQKRGTGASGD